MAYKSQKQELKRLYGTRCMLCCRNLKEKECTFHHIIPKSCGGKETIKNGTILCNECQMIIHTFNYRENGYKKLTEVIYKNMQKYRKIKEC